MSKTVIEVGNLRKYYGDTKAVDGIEFDLREG
ncbi:MAG TPA: ABC transporter ATP-binding protein, partial [Mesotoga infera]|nr:ABC transporter ATP-binding protein [Mesotoga infera]